MKSVRTEGCHVGPFRKFLGTACCTYWQSNMTNHSGHFHISLTSLNCTYKISRATHAIPFYEYDIIHTDGRITIRWQSVVQKWWKMKLTIENWKWIPPNNQLLGHNSPKYFLSSLNGCKVMHDCVKALFLPKYGVRTLHTRLLWYELLNSTHLLGNNDTKMYLLNLMFIFSMAK